MAWTSPRTWVSGETVTASLANTHWRDNLNYLYDNRYGVGRRNALINSHMDIWQRGTSFALSSSTKTYTADRWACYRAATGCTVSRQTGPTGQSYAMRVQRDSGNSSTTAITAYQALETVDSLKFAGQTAYLKLTLKAGANFSATSSAVTVKVTYGTGTDEDPTASWTGTTDALSTTQVITTTSTSYDFDSISIPSSATQVKVSVGFTPVGTASTNDWFELSAAQLSVNPAPGYERLPYQQTLALCQRYYESGVTYYYAVAAGAHNWGTWTGYKVSKRSNPTIALTSLANGGTAGATPAYSSPTSSIAYGLYLYRTYTGAGAGDFETSWTASAEL